MRKIPTTMAVMSLLFPMGANALGVGDIKLHSALNQLLNAEIPLVTSGSESISEVRVNLASPEAFSRAGIDRHYALSKLRFSPIQKPDGSYAIKVSSQDVIREPFLNFLLEVNWPQGRLFREFTVLLDPPATFEESVVSTPDLPQTEQSSDSVDEFPTESAVSSRMGRGGSYRPATSRASAEGRISGSEFGPVRRNETLWNIAKLVNRDPSITPEQMSIALYNANPQAFYQDSVNALKAGEKLKIPDRETILRLSPQEARTQFYQQAHAGKLSPRSAEKSQAQVPETTVGGERPSQGQLKLEAPSESKTGAESAIADATPDASKSKGDIALEVADTVKQENQEIRSRLADLEQQLSRMQQILSLKDEQIASMVQAQQQQNVPEGTPTKSPASQEAPQSIVPEAATEPSTAAAIAPQSAPITAEPAKVSPQPPAATKPQPQPQPATTPTSQDEGFLSELLDEPIYLALGGGAAILGLLAWLVIRRRATMIEEMESILAASELVRPERAAAPPPLMDETPSEQLSTVTKSSFLSEFTPSDFDALGGGADEVDPISEADVYLAYGRYKQAEELIRSAIEQHPERDECKLKLLEIHYATENKQAFEDYAKALFDQDKDSDPNFWDKVVEMGRELCPDSTLFRNALGGDLFMGNEKAPATGSRAGFSDSLDLDDDLIADLRRFEQANRQTASETETTSPMKDNAPEPSTITHQETNDEFENLPSLEFDSSLLKQDGMSEKAIETELTLDFDNLIQFETNKQPAVATNSASTPEQRDKTLDDILLELGAKGEAKPSMAGKSPQAAEKPRDEFDFDLELMSPPESSTQGDHEISPGTSELEYADLTDMDEHETKLDLAKAYVDMGDNKTALEILEDVAQKGNETQRLQARTWLDRLAKT